MASLTARIVLLLSITSSMPQSLPDFCCPSHINAKFKDSVQMVCNASKSITSVEVTFFSNDGKNETIIDTYRNHCSSDDRRIILDNCNAFSKQQLLSATLHINNVSVSDDGIYRWFLTADGGYKTLNIKLSVEVPYSNIALQMNRSAVVCEARGGNSRGQIHWFDGSRRNWTKSAQTVSNKTKDGFFILTSILPLKPLSIMEEYCCAVVYQLMGKTEETNSCISSSERPEDLEDIKKPQKLQLIVIIAIVLACAALAVYFHSGKCHVKRGRRLSEFVEYNDDKELFTRSTRGKHESPS
ncbi:uncharacterized protein LOC115090828 [Rhinatrema bivittatum]|uniref:uncharacterized protein LOC115090828 n=1 Tax=Rhinatrema bivittatum TaxID=194408 RepID=UPI001128953F|nr:uncharacterized protein LOC115090828 [Rhinatrema bivittatum]